MTKQEAIQAMKSGKKVTHRYFTPDEYLFMNIENEYTFEDGVSCSAQEFWKNRTAEYWETDWEIFNN